MFPSTGQQQRQSNARNPLRRSWNAWPQRQQFWKENLEIKIQCCCYDYSTKLAVSDSACLSQPFGSHQKVSPGGALGRFNKGEKIVILLWRPRKSAKSSPDFSNRSLGSIMSGSMLQMVPQLPLSSEIGSFWEKYQYFCRIQLRSAPKSIQIHTKNNSKIQKFIKKTLFRILSKIAPIMSRSTPCKF